MVAIVSYLLLVLVECDFCGVDFCVTVCCGVSEQAHTEEFVSALGFGEFAVGGDVDGFALLYLFDDGDTP